MDVVNRGAGPGWVYLICLDRPLGHARHYVGWANNLEARLAYHGGPGGARILAVAKSRGITWTLVRKMPGSKQDERRVKRAGGQVRYCPRCSPRPREGVWGNDQHTLAGP